MHQLPPSCLHLIAQHISSLTDLLSSLGSCKAFRQLSCQDLLASYLLQHVTCATPLSQLQQLLARVPCTAHLAVHCILYVLPRTGPASSHWCLIAAWAIRWAIHAGERQLIHDLLLIHPLAYQHNEPALAYSDSDGIKGPVSGPMDAAAATAASSSSVLQGWLSAEQCRQYRQTQNEQGALLLLVLTDCTDTHVQNGHLRPLTASSCREYARLVLGTVQEVIRMCPSCKAATQHQQASHGCMHCLRPQSSTSHSPANSVRLLQELLQLSCVGQKGDVHPMSWALKRLRSVPADQLSCLARDALAAKARVHPQLQTSSRTRHSSAGVHRYEAAMLPGSFTRHAAYIYEDVWAAPSAEDEAEAEFETVMGRLQQVVGVVADPWREVRWQQAGSNRLTALSPHPYWAWGLHDTCPASVIPEQDARFLDLAGDPAGRAAGRQDFHLWPAPLPPAPSLDHSSKCSPHHHTTESHQQKVSAGCSKMWDVGLLLQARHHSTCCSSHTCVGVVQRSKVAKQEGVWVQNDSLVYLAAYYGRWWLLKQLLEDTASQLGAAMEGAAAAGGQTWVVRALTHPDGPYTACVYTWTHQAMAKAAKCNQSRTLSWLLHRSEVEVPAEMLAVLCLHAVKSGSLTVVRQLIKRHGVKPNAGHPQATLLQLAACAGHACVIKALATELGSVDLHSPQGVCRALLLAAQAGHTAAVQAIVELACDGALPAIALALCTALHAQHKACALLLLSVLAWSLRSFAAVDSGHADKCSAAAVQQAVRCVQLLAGSSPPTMQAGITSDAAAVNANTNMSGVQLLQLSWLLTACSAYNAASSHVTLCLAILTTSQPTCTPTTQPTCTATSQPTCTPTSQPTCTATTQQQGDKHMATPAPYKQSWGQLTPQLCQAAGLCACLGACTYITNVHAPVQWVLGARTCHAPPCPGIVEVGISQAAATTVPMDSASVAGREACTAAIAGQRMVASTDTTSDVQTAGQAGQQKQHGLQLKTLELGAGCQQQQQQPSFEIEASSQQQQQQQPREIGASNQLLSAEIEADDNDRGAAVCAQLQQLLLQLQVAPGAHQLVGALPGNNNTGNNTHWSTPGSTTALPDRVARRQQQQEQQEPDQDVSRWVRYSSWPTHAASSPAQQHMPPALNTRQALWGHPASERYDVRFLHRCNQHEPPYHDTLCAELALQT